MLPWKPFLVLLLGVFECLTLRAEHKNSHISSANDVIKLLQEMRNTDRTFRLKNLLEETEVVDWLDVNDRELGLGRHDVSVASWRYSTNLTQENADMLSEITVTEQQWRRERVKEAKSFLENIRHFRNKTAERMLRMWVNDDCIPDDPTVARSMTVLENDLERIYSSAQLEKDGDVYRLDPELTELMATSRDYDTLLWAWQGWRDVTGPNMRSKFTELVSFMNTAATDNGLNDMGESWRISSYEVDNIEPMVDELYRQILPLYQQLHAYVRRKLAEVYPEVDTSGPIPAHILGDMWAQQWTNIYDIVQPYPDVNADDVTAAMLDQGYTVTRMYEVAEGFFTSIGLEPMTEAFWERSMLERPRDGRPVECHGSAEDFLTQDDFRIKMCTVITEDDLRTVHHEMGHIEYFMQYRHQPTVFRAGANAAFHEAIGDTIDLSVSTPGHLRAIGLLTDPESKQDCEGDCQGRHGNSAGSDGEQPDTDDNEFKKTINFQMKMALQKVAFLPFGYLIDKWRWAVFRGNIGERDYNSEWWEYREQFQGVQAPITRSEADFDPGAKFHVPAFVAYIRYFLSFIGQFQFHKALCEEAGHHGPLYTCDIYQSEEAGRLLSSVLELGASKPWPEAMKMLTGQREFKTDAIFEYFQPLHDWLLQQNQGQDVGW